MPARSLHLQPVVIRLLKIICPRWGCCKSYAKNEKRTVSLIEQIKTMAPRWLHDLVHLFYPRLCMACGEHLPRTEKLMCLPCQYQLPQTAQHTMVENAFTERFWGRVRLETGAALYFFSKSGRVQRLIHQLKYEHKPDIGYELGLLYGNMLREQSHYRSIDAIVPVPLHPKKQHQRGYNQAAVFGKGIAEALQRPLLPNALHRPVFATSQTQKSRMDRMDNVMNAFELHPSATVAGQHILLVDDVLTTGATLEACALALLAQPNVRISMATIALAGD